MKNVYIAGRFEAQPRLREVARQIQDQGLAQVVSTWLEAEESVDLLPEQQVEYANRDLDEIETADLLILDTFNDDLRGGREFEAGCAAAFGAEVWVVGPRRNIFHSLVPQFDYWDEALAALAKENAENAEDPEDAA